MVKLKLVLQKKNKYGDGYHIKNQDLCKTDENRIVTIASPDVAFKILSDFSTREKTILCFDEPTIGADNVTSKQLHENMMLLTCFSKISILISATLPDSSNLLPIYNSFKEIFKDAEVVDIVLNEIYVGCDIFTFDKQYVLPHSNIKTSIDLIKLIDSINKIPFLGRLYTGPALKQLHEKMTEVDVKDLPDLSTLFSDVNNMSANKMRELSMMMLNLLKNYSDDIIEKVCKFNEPVVISELVDDSSDSDNDFSFSKKKEVESDKLDFLNLGTTDAYKCTGSTIIVSDDPLTFAKTNFESLLYELAYDPENDKSDVNKFMQKIEQNYVRALDFYKGNIDRIEKKVDNAMEKSKQLQDLSDSQPKLAFSNEFQINTVQHMKKFSQKPKNINVRTPMNITDLFHKLENSTVQNNIKALLFCGIGIYTHKQPKIFNEETGTYDDNAPPLELDKIYLDTILDLAGDGSLAYIISDASFCHGINMPLNREIINDDYAVNHSMLNLIQYMGRVGRLGKSFSAEIYVSNDLAKRIINFSHSLEETKIDSQNMVNVFEQCVLKKIELENKEVFEAMGMLEKKERQKSPTICIGELIEKTDSIKPFNIEEDTLWKTNDVDEEWTKQPSSTDKNWRMEKTVAVDSKKQWKPIVKEETKEKTNSSDLKKSWRQSNKSYVSSLVTNTTEIKPSEIKPFVNPVSKKYDWKEKKFIDSSSGWRKV